MSDPAALSELITRLKAAEMDWDAENIADLLWLACYLTGEGVQRPQEPAEPPVSESLAADPPVSESPVSAPPISEPTPRERVNTPPTSPPPPPPPPPPSDPSVGLYADTAQRQRQGTKKAPEKGGIPFQTPTAPALRKTLAIGRSLRPLMRKVDSYTQRVLDEDATAEQTAEQGFCMTVVRPAKERWLEVALVVEASAASFLWKETIRDFKQVLERQGAFRCVTEWHLQASQGEVKLFARRPQPGAPQSPRSPKELIDTSGRRLILLVSDCISPAWHSGLLQETCLALWTRHNPLAIVQLLPGHLWSRTALSAALEVQLGAWTPGAINQQLLFYEPPIGAESAATEGLKLPVMTLEPNSLAQWAKMVAGWGESWTPGVWFDPGWQTLQVPPTTTATESLTAEQLVQLFTKTASGLSKRLAGLMALVPVNLPIIYLLQETMLPESTPLHLAEIFMSGLIERKSNPESDSASDSASTQVTYDFVADVREPLMASVPTPIKADVLDRVSQYIGKKLKRSIYSFTALLQLEQELGEMGGADLLKFADIAKQVLTQMGGDYAALVNTLEHPTDSGFAVSPPTFDIPPLRSIPFIRADLIDAEDKTDSAAAWPPLQMDAFEIATITVEPEPEPEPEPDQRLDLFEFKIATLEKRDVSWFERLSGRRAEWVIKERQGQARRFLEVLRSEPATSSVDDAALEIKLVNRLKSLPEAQFNQVSRAFGQRTEVSEVRTQNRLAYALIQAVQMSATLTPGEAHARLLAFQDQLEAMVGVQPEFALEMVAISGGSFTMGSPANEPERLGSEGPRREVAIQSCWMGRYPITQAQWRFVAGLEAVNQELEPDPSRFKGDNRPVERVSWDEAVEFCQRLSRHTGRDYRLPSEAEWEYACRAGTDTPFSFGKTLTTELANYDGNYTYDTSPEGEYRRETTPVDHFGVANAWGLSDMHGNVWEWCLDHWYDNYQGAPVDGEAWIEGANSSRRIIRGGSWNFNPSNCRSASRFNDFPDVRYYFIGFRVVCVAPRDSSRDSST